VLLLFAEQPPVLALPTQKVGGETPEVVSAWNRDKGGCYTNNIPPIKENGKMKKCIIWTVKGTLHTLILDSQ
jgi:hypothetical protein